MMKYAPSTAATLSRERHVEIAVMRSLGFISRLILSLPPAEALIIGLVEGVPGYGSALLVLS